MLPLADERWGQLTTFFGKPEDVPKVLEEWLASIGFDQEETIYQRDLFNLFLHQGTITNVAFIAIVPPPALLEYWFPGSIGGTTPRAHLFEMRRLRALACH